MSARIFYIWGCKNSTGDGNELWCHIDIKCLLCARSALLLDRQSLGDNTYKSRVSGIEAQQATTGSGNILCVVSRLAYCKFYHLSRLLGAQLCHCRLSRQDFAYLCRQIRRIFSSTDVYYWEVWIPDGLPIPFGVYQSDFRFSLRPKISLTLPEKLVNTNVITLGRGFRTSFRSLLVFLPASRGSCLSRTTFSSLI